MEGIKYVHPSVPSADAGAFRHFYFRKAAKLAKIYNSWLTFSIDDVS